MTTDQRSHSYWLESLDEPLQARPALDGTQSADVVIVGAGYTGLWTAYYLNQLQPDLDIAMVEAEIAGFGASGRNGGWCSGFFSGIEKWLDDPTHRDGAIRLQRMMYDTVREVGTVTDAESIDCHFEQAGALEIAVIPQHEARFHQEIEYQHSFGFTEDDYRWLGPTESEELIRVDRSSGALLMSHCAAIHPARLSRGLAECLEQKGISLYENSAVTALGDGYVDTQKGRISAPITLLATEGYGGELPGEKRRLIPVHSMMVCTEPLSATQLEEIVMKKRFTFANGDRIVTYGQLTADNRLAFGCRGTYLFGAKICSEFPADDPEFEHVREALLRFFPSLRVIRLPLEWGGAMGVSRSLQPSVQFDPKTGLGSAGGYFGNGVAAAHLAGKTLADLVLSRDTDRVHTPWVNAPSATAAWEPEPFRWLGFRSARRLMHMADRAEYRNSRVTPLITRALDVLLR